jgi:hypothetical protein
VNACKKWHWFKLPAEMDALVSFWIIAIESAKKEDKALLFALSKVESFYNRYLISLDYG